MGEDKKWATKWLSYAILIQSPANNHFPTLLLSQVYKRRMKAVSGLTTESATEMR